MKLKTDVDELLSRWERDGCKESAEQICAEYPAQLEEVRHRMQQIKRMRRLLEDSRQDTSAPSLAPTTDLPRATPGPGAVAAGTPADADGHPQIDGYRILAPLGRGGMGVVWRAVQLGTKREVALKLMNADAFRSERARRRFEREVELAARLSHRNVVRVYDSGVHDGRYYYAMELIDGVPLDEYARACRLGRRSLLLLLAGVADAVQYAHQNGILHRDLKPSNILVSPDGEPHVLDFGLAVPLPEDGQPGPRGRDFAGTFGFMSPEQVDGDLDRMDTRSDVYGLGIILIGLLELQDSVNANNAPLPPDQRVAKLLPDAELRCLLLKATARDREARYASAGVLAADLRSYLACDPLAAREPTLRYILGRKLRKYRVAAGLAAAAALAGAGVTLWQYNRGAVVHLYSDPPGALAVINGTPHDCPTNCAVYLPRGRHEVRLRLDEGFAESVRHVEVAWGRARSDRVEPIALTPDSQEVIFESDPPGAEVVVRRDGPGSALVWEGSAGGKRSLPKGRYVATFRLHGRSDKVIRLEILGSREARYVKETLN